MGELVKPIKAGNPLDVLDQHGQKMPEMPEMANQQWEQSYRPASAGNVASGLLRHPRYGVL